MYGCAGVPVCHWVCVFASRALQAGGSERLGSFNTALIRAAHAHNGSNETESCGSSAYRPLRSCHILFVQAALWFLKRHLSSSKPEDRIWWFTSRAVSDQALSNWLNNDSCAGFVGIKLSAWIQRLKFNWIIVLLAGSFRHCGRDRFLLRLLQQKWNKLLCLVRCPHFSATSEKFTWWSESTLSSVKVIFTSV